MKAKSYKLFFLFLLILFTSCKRVEFKKIKNANTKSVSITDSPIIKIQSYTLKYNAKANGYIIIMLEDGSEYEAQSVDGSSFSSINSLLVQPEVMFDTKRKEVIVTKFISRL